MIASFHPPVAFVMVLPCSTLPLEVFLKTLTVRPARHSSLPEVTFPWKASLVALYFALMWLVAANAAVAPTNMIVAATTAMMILRPIPTSCVGCNAR